MTAMEALLVGLLVRQGSIRGTAHVGYALWPDRRMQPQGAALAAGKIIRGAVDKGYVASIPENKLSRYEATVSGTIALTQYQASLVDERQHSLL